ncbi:probable ribonuclease 11 [Manis pentadactyla]|uniref:probable ribonuclease 11 n=1 Tax=Manis pentadactyla TaxID=143292 RepID=UPI00255C71B4|nr:probable ribonuclease 11 [Manis pentadactyla]
MTKKEYTRSERGTFCLLLFSLGLGLTGVSESAMEKIQEFSEEEIKYDVAKNDQEKQSIEILMNLTLLYKNTSLSMSKGILSSSVLTFRRLHYCFPKEDGPGSDKEYCSGSAVWKKASEANGSCKLSNNFIPGSMEVIRGIPKTPSCKYGQNPGIRCSESPELETTMCELTMGK